MPEHTPDLEAAEIIFPAGEHTLDGPLALEQPFSLHGRGAGVTTLVFDVAGAAVRVTPGADLNPADALSHASSIEGITIVNVHPDGWAMEMESVKNLVAHDLQLVAGTYQEGGAGCLRVLRGHGSAAIDMQGLRCFYGRTGLLLDGIGTGTEATWVNANRIEAMIQGSLQTEVAVDLAGASSNQLELMVQRADVALRLDRQSRYNQIDLVVEIRQSDTNVEVAGSRNRIVGHFDERLVVDAGVANEIRGTAAP